MAALSTSSGVALVAGAVLGAASAEPVRRLSPRGSVRAAGAGLITCAVIYPAARRSHVPSAGLVVEVAAVLATTALAGFGAATPPTTGRRLLAAGWAAHALFDALQGPSDDSRLPGWYAPVCAGFDLGYAVRLAG